MLCLVVVVLFCGVQGDDLLVTTRNGVLRGQYLKSDRGRVFRSFSGVPYAAPPVGNLRFEPPKPPQKWTGVLNATKDANLCMQVSQQRAEAAGSEDCLYLNVYVPKVSHRMLPVMVFVHGGSFLSGSGSYYRPELLMDQDVVLVTINYRLGVFGFLSTGDLEVPGNNGIKDQVMALKWVQDNINWFNGDARKVMIFGQSAGGGSVHLLMLSTLAKGLFHAAATHSASAFCGTTSTPSESKLKAQTFGAALRCPINDTSKMVECLKSLPAATFMDLDLLTTFGLLPRFTPTVEVRHPGALITKLPMDIIRSRKTNDVPWIVGQTTDEGGSIAATLVNTPGSLEMAEKNLELLVPGLNQTSIEAVRQFYFDGKNLSQVETKQISNFITDALFTMCIQVAVVAHRIYLRSPVYYYLFGYRGSQSASKFYGGGDKDYGVVHGDDLQYLFHLPFYGLSTLNETDLQISSFVTSRWANFAKARNPNLASARTRWNPVATRHNEYLYIGGVGDIEMRRDMFANRTKFWRRLTGL